jgi:hypothetical protein
VTTVTLVINEGAYYEGQLEMTPPDQRPASMPRPITAVSSPVQMSQGSTGARPANQPAGETGQSAASSTFIRRLGGPETPWDNRTGTPEPEDDDSGS